MGKRDSRTKCADRDEYQVRRPTLFLSVARSHFPVLHSTIHLGLCSKHLHKKQVICSTSLKERLFLFLTFPHIQRQENKEMAEKQDMNVQEGASVDSSMAQDDKGAKREMARRLLEGDGADKDEAMAVSLLEDCVAHGDTDPMVMLAKWCALGRGIEHNAERAEALVSEAAEKGNHEARILLRLINNWKRKESIDLWGL